MLINIDPILSPELLSTLHSMGHGDTLVLADANFPAASLATKLIRLDGLNINTELLTLTKTETDVPEYTEEGNIRIKNFFAGKKINWKVT